MGVFRTKGKGALYNQTKQRVSIALTPDGLAGVDELAQELGLSRSELIEQVGRKLLPVMPPGQSELTELTELTSEEENLLGKSSSPLSLIGSG